MRWTLATVACLLLAGCTALPEATDPAAASGVMPETPTGADGVQADAPRAGLEDLLPEPVDLAASDQQRAGDGTPQADAPGRGDRSGHGEPRVLEGALLSEPGDAEEPRWRVARTTYVQNDLGGAELLRAHIDMDTGALEVRTWQHGGYRLVIEAEGWGATERDAMLAFESLQAALDDGLSSSGLAVTIDAAYAPYQAGDQGLLVGAPYRSMDLVLYVPWDVHHQVAVTATSADVVVTGIDGRLDVTTSTGDITVVDTTAPRLQIDTPEGVVALRNVSAGVTTVTGGTFGLSAAASDLGRFQAVGLLDDVRLDDVALHGDIRTPGAIAGSVTTDDLDVSAASVELDIIPAGSGGVRARTEDGPIDLHVALSDGVGLDGRAQTGLPVAVADVDIPGRTLRDERTVLDMPQIHHVQGERFEGHPIVFFVSGTSEQGDVHITA